jgi:glycosyltransferase involved in cell wall biosynthesis
MTEPQSRYVLVTPARNEAAFIELTLRSVIAQTVLPLRWVVVSDGSTDGTDDIVRRYAAKHPWIELVRRSPRTDRNFAGKAYAFNEGYGRLQALSYDAIGSLDADISFDEDYFAFLLAKLAQFPRLGLVGTPYKDTSMYDYRFVGLDHVSGACQLFRRECFEAIGGYQPVRSGGIDLIAVLSARSKGWETRTFTEKICRHHRKMGAAVHTGLRERLHRGKMDYLLGSHPLWELFRGVYQMKNRPYVVGGVLILVAYLWNMLRGVERTMPGDLMRLRRSEQMKRLRRLFTRPWHGHHRPRDRSA